MEGGFNASLALQEYFQVQIDARRSKPTDDVINDEFPRMRRGEAIPPIEVYRVGDLHFVSDGHHRVSIAAATGRQTIDAYVTEVLTTVPPASTTRPGRPGPAARTLNGPSAVPQPAE